MYFANCSLQWKQKMVKRKATIKFKAVVRMARVTKDLAQVFHTAEEEVTDDKKEKEEGEKVAE